MQNTNDRTSTDQRKPDGSADNVNNNVGNRSDMYPSDDGNRQANNSNMPSDDEDTDEE
jgi:hypothetical protein